MAVVALVGLGFGAAFEAINHFRRDRLLRQQAKIHRYAIVHLRRAWECKEAEARALPYRPAERAKLLQGDGAPTMMPSAGYSSWEIEGADHRYWAERFYSQGEWCVERLQGLEARLFLP